MAKTQASETTKAKTAHASPASASDDLSLAELAQGVLDRKFTRLRVAQLRRLAEAVLAAEQKRAKRKAKAPETKKKASGKKRKLAKIPRPKKRS